MNGITLCRMIVTRTEHEDHTVTGNCQEQKRPPPNVNVLLELYCFQSATSIQLYFRC